MSSTAISTRLDTEEIELLYGVDEFEAGLLALGSATMIAP